MNFADLQLSEQLLRSIEDAGYSTPTPIQAQAIPYVLMGRDILGCAQTGTGKTASFTLPMIEVLAAGQAKARMPRSLILEPTRELAAQVAENFDTYGKYHPLSKALIIGGESMADQLRVLERGADVLIATPGRLLDVFNRGRLLLNDVRILVIDEADRMLDMGFIPDVERIVSLVSRMRQTLFFSATMPPPIRRLADAFLSNPKEIIIAPPSTPAEMVDQNLIVVSSPGSDGQVALKEKRAALRALIEREDVRTALIFCNRKREVGVVCRSLVRHGFDAGMLHGDLAQATRTEVLDRFRRGDLRLLVCSDVAARGIDIQELSHVFNFDVPTNPEDYIHRIGRTGRAGRPGRALTIAVSADGKYIGQIERLIDKPIPRLHLDGQPAELLETAAPRRRKRRGERSSGKEPSRHSRPRPAAGEQPAKPVHPQPSQVTAERAADPAAERGATEAVSHDAPAAPAPREAERPRQRGERAGRQRGGEARSRRERGREREQPVVGMGDDVPAFMLRDIKLPKK
jgi:superfamily II DNA/RNA helicase